jgi:hypothetical protein
MLAKTNGTGETSMASVRTAGFALAALACAVAPAGAQAPKLPVPAIDQSAVGARG